MKKKKESQAGEPSKIGKKVIGVFTAGENAKYNYKQIAAKIGIFDKTGREEVKKIIEDFLDKKILWKAGSGKYKLNPKYLNEQFTSRNYVTGRLQITSTGAAFLIQDAPDTEDIFIADGNLGNALHNDTVKVLVFPLRRKKGFEGQVVEIIERSRKQLVGVMQIKKGVAYFIPDNPSYRRDILIPSRLLKGAKTGDKVVVIITDWVQGTRSPLGEVLHVLGKPGENNVEMNAILAEYNFPLSFPEDVEKEAESLNRPIPEEEIRKRRDFRDIYTYTIDPADAKDFDDAISYQKLDNGLHRVGVHIADVSHYVRPGSRIDQEAYDRATSIYLVDRTIPMFPEVLSNNLCSLRPREDKLCYSAVFDLDDQAKVRKEWFGRTVIHSDRRFSYEEAQEIIDNKTGDFSEHILPVHQLAEILRKERFEHNAINFETEEVRFNLDENGKPIGIYLKVQKEANFLIEEFMLLANKKVAEKIGKKKSRDQEVKTFVYRVHDEPIQDKLETFKNFVRSIGYEIKTTSKKALVSSFHDLFESTKNKSEYNMLTKLSIRLMSRAVYSTDNIGHYGLAFPYYTHFTSPIRRYPDLMVHRLFDAYLHQKPSANKEEYEGYCRHASKMEQLAAEAERTSIKYKQAEYMMDRIGEVLDATVSGISKWGVYAEIVESKGEGLIPMRCFDDDFYYIDEEHYTLVGLHKGSTLRFGDPIKVRLVSVDLQKKQMTFERG
ncbi:ribonuclease R [Bacteroidales bacterium OttesenSCG-928-C03]|nr:ribonuclease R [Bacteroidales bacterium OttesenSCG-928-C03]